MARRAGRVRGSGRGSEEGRERRGKEGEKGSGGEEGCEREARRKVGKRNVWVGGWVGRGIEPSLYQAVHAEGGECECCLRKSSHLPDP